MRADNTTGHNRTIHLTDIPDPDGRGLLPELIITVNYAGQGNADKGITLDSVVVPALVRALNQDGQPALGPATDRERQTALDLLLDDLAYAHEGLVASHNSAATALAAYDAYPQVTLLTKLDPTQAATIRANVKTYLDDYLDD